MKKILIGIIFLTIYINAEILELSIIKNNNKVKIVTKYKNLKIDIHEYLKLSDNKKAITATIGNQWNIKNKTIYEFDKYEILNEKNIKHNYIIGKNKISIFIPEKKYTETFIIKTYPDKPKYNWEEKYKEEIEENNKRRKENNMIYIHS